MVTPFRLWRRGGFLQPPSALMGDLAVRRKPNRLLQSSKSQGVPGGGYGRQLPVTGENMKRENGMDGFPDSDRIQELLDQVRMGDIPKDKSMLLTEGRKLRGVESSHELWLYMPFSMMCETYYGNKEGYQDIIRQFSRIKVCDYDRMVKGACEGRKQDSRELAWFLAACTDTLEFTSMEIYEHYRYLADLIQATVRILAKECWQGGGIERTERETAGVFADAVLKSCRMRVLLREKYEDYGRELLARSQKNSYCLSQDSRR